MHTLLVADDHPMFRDAMVGAIAAALPGSRVLEADSLAAAVRLAENHDELDLLLLDLGLPDAKELAGLQQLREALPGLPVAIISAEQGRETVLEAIRLGAVGYIPKSTPRDDLIAALQQVLEGQMYLPADILRRPPAPVATSRCEPVADLESSALAQLTAKQLQVLERMTCGDSNKQIARELNIAETTVKTHVSAILNKLGVNSRIQAILAAREHDLAFHARPIRQPHR
ncbi:LuxR C-terminal-related transcriptional regulator [Halomonas elongata]|uniref:LuxR C-terminal-related transcriptional regulator n=1 Tax=Halomonas elongata TaxID=2746 RepID=UPI0038D4F245